MKLNKIIMSYIIRLYILEEENDLHPQLPYHKL